MFNTKDELQQRWVEQNFGRSIPMPRHTLPSPQAFVVAALGGLGWAMHPHSLVREHLDSGALVELKPGCPLDIPLYWQHARMASSLLRGLTQAVSIAAKNGLVQLE
jgi:LysR family transcriptional regulator (chromosome initiation inhibitor)